VAYVLKARTVEQEKQPLLTNGSETIFVSRQRPQTKRFPQQQSAWNNRGTVETGFSTGIRAKGLQGARIGQLEGTATQRVLEPGSRLITIVRSLYQATTNEDTAGWKRLSLCSSDL
jgi:hypothetical protein